MTFLSRVNKWLSDKFDTKCVSCLRPVPTFPNTHLRAGDLHFCNSYCLMNMFLKGNEE